MEIQPGLSVDGITAKEATEPAPPQVIERLEHFPIIRNRWLRLTLDTLPWLLGFLLLLDWLVGQNAYTGDLFLLSAALGVILELLILRSLFAQTPRALLSIWTRDLFIPARPEIEADFLAFLSRFEQALHHRLGWLVGGVFALLGIILTYPLQTLLKTGVFPFSVPQALQYYLLARPVYLYFALGIVLGLMIWRVIIIALFLYRMGREFEIRMLPNHPDRCGGLKPLGDLCLTIAMLLLVPAIYLTIWASLNALFGDNPNWAIYDLLWAPAFRQILALLSIVALFAFFLPVYSIHEEMIRHRREIQSELDRLSQEIDRILLELRTQSTSMTPQEGSQKLEMLGFLQKVYQEQDQIPTWPFDWKLLVRFGSAQALPVLTLLGTSRPVIDLVSSLLAGLQ